MTEILFNIALNLIIKILEYIRDRNGKITLEQSIKLDTIVTALGDIPKRESSDQSGGSMGTGVN
jgi:hypothetical protein